MKAVYAGSFDPITLGHVDIIGRLLNFTSELYVLVTEASNKSYLFTRDERMQLVRSVLKRHSQVKVEGFDGLTVEFARRVGAPVIIRGIRAVADYDQEMAMASVNRVLAAEIETLTVFASPKYNFISSRLVKEVAQHGGELSSLVPQEAAEALRKKFR